MFDKGSLATSYYVTGRLLNAWADEVPDIRVKEIAKLGVKTTGNYGRASTSIEQLG